MPPTTGDEFLDRLDDSRTVYYKGEEIDDVREHPATRGMIQTQAELFDLQHTDEFRDQLTYTSPETGERESIFYKPAESTEDLKERREATRIWHDYTCGMSGRAADLMASTLTGLMIQKDEFCTEDHPYGENIEQYYEYAQMEDLCLTHALIDPQIDRAESSSMRQGDEDAVDRPGALRKVDENEDGIIVSGARMLATIGPQADELLVFPYGQHGEGEDDQALAFAIPIEADGLRLICRPSMSGEDERNHPLSTRLDEMDTFMVFDEVFIPYDRVFIDCNVELANKMARQALPYLLHQTLSTDLSKTEFILGLVLSLTESTGVDQYFHVQAKMGEITELLNLLESSAVAAEEKAEEYGDTGYVIPNLNNIWSALSLFADKYPRAIEIIRDVSGSGLIGVPAYEDLEAEDPLGSDVEAYFRGKDMDASKRISIQKIAYDVAISDFGSRENHYERFHTGGPYQVKAMQYRNIADEDKLKQKTLENAFRNVDSPKFE